MTKTCEWCGEKYARGKTEQNREWRRRRFCGRSCFGKWSNPRKPRDGRRTCPVCKTEFGMKPGERPYHFERRRTCGDRRCVGYFGGVAGAEAMKRRPRKPSPGAARLSANRKKQLKEQEGSCAQCGSEKDLEVHHRDSDSGNQDSGNLLVLCHDCHKVVEWHLAPVIARFSALLISG